MAPPGSIPRTPAAVRVAWGCGCDCTMLTDSFRKSADSRHPGAEAVLSASTAGCARAASRRSPRAPQSLLLYRGQGGETGSAALRAHGAVVSVRIWKSPLSSPHPGHVVSQGCGRPGCLATAASKAGAPAVAQRWVLHHFGIGLPHPCPPGLCACPFPHGTTSACVDSTAQ